MFCDSPIDGNVEVWAVWLNASEAANLSFRSVLSQEEVLRADRFATKALRASYQASHGVLRVLLSRYLKCHPRSFEFTVAHAGKPSLTGDFEMQFNMSHSGSMAVYAFAPSGALGIDIEQVRSLSDLEGIARKHFCPAETKELLSIGDEKQRQDAFFRCWTRKESYIKAVGEGLSLPLDQFQVTLLPGAPARVVHIGNSERAASAWALQHIGPAPEYVGSVAYPSGTHRCKIHPPCQAQDILDAFSG